MLRALWRFLVPKYLHGHYETVRYAFPVFFGALLMTGLASVIGSNTSFVTIEADTVTVARDQEFFVDVRVTTHVPVNAINLEIAYSEDTIAIEGIDTGQSVITLWTEEPYAENGVLYLRGGTFRKGFIGEHQIARIRVRALEAGDARLFVQDTELVAGDGLGTPVRHTNNQGQNSIQIAVVGDTGEIKGEVALSVVTDMNGDGSVNLTDVSLFMSAWFSRATLYDFDDDGRMTFRDFSILLAETFIR
jgi:hypothetical protein